MPRSYESLTLQDAKQMLADGELKAEQFGIPYSMSVVDAGGHLIAFVRQDGALIGSIDLAMHKALTARIFNSSTENFAEAAVPGKPLYGIQNGNHGKIIIFGGGIPVSRLGIVIGAVGASAGTVLQDVEVAKAMMSSFENGR